MDDLVVLSLREQEYLLRTIESALQVRRRRQFFLWTQGQFQSLLPHEIMVCIQFGGDGEVVHIECMHSVILDEQSKEQLCNPHDGFALRLARHCRNEERLPLLIEQGERSDSHPLSRLRAEMEIRKLGISVVHSTENLPGGASFFALFGLPDAADSRHSFFLELLLPYLHISLLRLVANAAEPLSNPGSGSSLARPVTAREIDILRWVKQGKSNFEIGIILGISALTVKNHLQKIYKKLNVQNRTQAVSRCMDLRLLG
ncbi:XrtB/PEP-CTERM-associated transcriptional regulator EpsA [Undibacterium parvum]|uniref:Helix-turn-helix transcriptional regulator n=1 Tax=Undibacterium parvum TaxID=401471 RepID=A0A3S9HMP7_9BURK|nr:XrtB/PEP-CTERM-associated transcriptional regulator EpsA [Undibacterium parvum]AZP13371.1 helix-turn-helix transcriptional regulator [Undibacterium parvum]MCX7221151.1 LuxR C-terminal-related transcriptional regulator [Burkholderiales bacterium]